MQTALRRMGNSAGMIVPRALLAEIGITVGAAMDLRVEDGRLIATPASGGSRTGWAAAAEAIADADADQASDWQSFGNEGDADLLW